MAAIIANHISAASGKGGLEAGMVLGAMIQYHARMTDRDKFKDFRWWCRLAVVVGIIWFGISVYRADFGFLGMAMLAAIVRSLAASLAAAGVVAAVGLFVSRLRDR